MSSTPVTRKVKLQKVGNSLRVTIPKELAEMLSLKEGDTMSIRTTFRDVVTTMNRSLNEVYTMNSKMTEDDDDKGKIVIEKVEDDVPAMAKFCGMLKVKETRKWPSPKEIKSIWE